jgi:tetratricopeptide (TPR) repeat protein
MVKAQAGILETDSDDGVDAKLKRAVDRMIDEDANWVLSHLRPLVGQTGDSAGSQEEAFAAWRRFFEALAEAHALVLVFEDVQWADDGLLDFIEHLADWVRDVPMLILCTARLELLERRPTWGGGKLNAANIALAPLSSEETAKLIASLSERPLLEANTQAELLERAGGNPLYAEQYVRMLAERGTADALPESVQGIIAARLDALAPDEKSVLQDAAVMGKVFWLGALGVDERRLHALQQKEFVQRARRSSVAGETEFSFKHVLVRDVAYGQIPRAERAQKHLRAAEWIESLGRPDDHAEMVAHHYANALELKHASGGDANGLTTRTRDALRDAGLRAASLNAVVPAERYFTDALELTPADDLERHNLLFKLGQAKYVRSWEGSEELAEARAGFLAAGDPESAAEAALMIADNLWAHGKGSEVAAYVEDAHSLVAGRPPSRGQASVLAEISRYHMLADRNEDAIKTGREALRMAEQLGLDDIRARVLNNIGVGRVNAGDPDGLADLDESIAVATRLNLAADIRRGYNNRATLNVLLGRLGEGETDLLEAYRLAQHFGQRGYATWSEGGPLLGGPYQRGEWDEAVERAEAFLARLGDEGHYQAGSSHLFRALIRAARGDDAGAAEDAARALELSRPVGDPQISGTTLLAVTSIYMTIGDEARARGLFDESLALLGELGQIGWLAIELNSLAWAGRKLGRSEEVLAAVRDEPLQTPWLLAGRAVADGDFVRAANIFGQMGHAAAEAFYRLCAAEELVAEARRAEADEQLRPALAFFRNVHAARYVREGEALLAATA